MSLTSSLVCTELLLETSSFLHLIFSIVSISVLNYYYMFAFLCPFFRGSNVSHPLDQLASKEHHMLNLYREKPRECQQLEPPGYPASNLSITHQLNIPSGTKRLLLIVGFGGANNVLTDSDVKLQTTWTKGQTHVVFEIHIVVAAGSLA